MIELFTDGDGRMWEVVDFKLVPPGDKKRRVPIGHHEADGRAFHRVFEETRVYWFGKIAHRDISARTLAAQFENARPTTQTAAKQFWDRSSSG
jgi:hypothetical protein